MKQNPRKILVIDDEPSVARTLALLLQRAGFTSLVAMNGEEGLALANSEKPSLIFCDERMPGLSGGEVLQRLRQNPITADIPVVMMGGSHVEGLCDWTARGAAAFLPKPFTASQLPDFVRDILPQDQTPAR